MAACGPKAEIEVKHQNARATSRGPRNRAILLAIHDMKEDLEAPLALQKGALAELMSLKVRPAPQLKLYRDIATAILRMEVVIRSTAMQAMKNGETKH